MDRSRFTALQIDDVGQTAFVLRTFSSHNRLAALPIFDTGRTHPQYAEGVYTGPTQEQWCTYTGCKADRSDSNLVTGGTFGPYIRSQVLDFKDGGTDTVADSNAIDGTGSDPSTGGAVVNLFGNRTRNARATFTRNRVTAAGQSAVKVEALASGWGQRAVVRGDRFTLSRTTRPAVVVGGASAGTATVGCDNAVSGGRLSNVACKP